jgi:YggT family protein
VVSVLLQVAYVALLLFLYILFARFVMGLVMTLGRRWRPGRGAAAALEVVWSVTDPPLKALRRVIPPVRLGGVSLDLASLVVLFGVWLLLFLLAILIQAAEGL